MVISAVRFDGVDPDQIEDGGSVGMASPSDSLKKEFLQAQNERVGRNSTKRQPHLIYLGVVRAIIRISLTVTLTCCSGTMATAADDLYRAQAIVTGQGEANRIIGFASCLEDVLIKVSGAQKLAGDRRLAAYKSNAKGFVRAFSYHDQMSGTPTRDEQGTRDRPYDLIVDFDEKKIDDLLKALRLKPWLSHRPILAVFVEMQQGPKKYMVTAVADQAAFQRESLLAAAARGGDACCVAERGSIGGIEHR